MSAEAFDTFVPLSSKARTARRVVDAVRSVHEVALLDGLARAYYWQRMLDAGEMESGSAIARAEGLHQSVVNELLRLTLLAPDIIERIVAGRQPRRLHLMWFQRHRLPVDWDAQRRIVERFEKEDA